MSDRRFIYPYISRRLDEMARIFKDIRMKALVQDVRFKVFSILDTLMAKHREGILFDS